MATGLAGKIARLEAAKRDFGQGAAGRVEKLLHSFAKTKITDPESLIRVHDALLFLRAFPQGLEIAQLTEILLRHIAQQVKSLREKGGVMEPFDDEPVSGIAWTQIRYAHTFEVARWLAKRYPKTVTADWDIDEQGPKFVNTLPRCVPLIEDDTLVEPDVPYMRWLANASGGGGKELGWLLDRVDQLPVPITQKTELWDSLSIDLLWELEDYGATRTFARWPIVELFVHDQPLIVRKDVTLLREMQSPEIPTRKIERTESESVIRMAREALSVRYRELYGTTRADLDNVYEANVGRGVFLYLWGLPPDRRMPLRAYLAGCTFKNGVPINYVEAISLFEWMEVGFNTFYTYREGETAWIYSKMLHLFHQLMGVTCISVYPYQIGFENEEAIESGAFWFYRKLGFRPGRPDLLKITETEERKLAKNPKHRTSKAKLRKLAEGHIFFEFGKAERGFWDTFSTRNIGMAVQRRMAAQFGGDPERMRAGCSERLAKSVGIELGSLPVNERWALENFAFVLSLIPDIADWSKAERQALGNIIRAKVGAEEREYSRLMQQHRRLREALQKLGSARVAAKAAAG